MANITLNENPQLNLEMEAMTVNTEGHCDEWNRRHKQLLENDHYLSEEQKKNNEPEFTVAEKRENIASKEKMPKILGKIAKFFTDLKTVAFSGKYSDLDGKPAIVNNNTATEAGSALDARQANPTIEGTMANQISQLNSDLNDINGSLNNNRDIIWSGTQKMTLSAVNSWENSDKFITLQPGKYILGFKAHTNCKDDVYIDTSMDTKEYTFIYYEKNVNIPVSTKMATDGSSTVRSVTNTFVANIIEPVELYFLCWSDHILTLTYELWALRLI